MVRELFLSDVLNVCVDSIIPFCAPGIIYASPFIVIVATRESLSMLYKKTSLWKDQWLMFTENTAFECRQAIAWSTWAPWARDKDGVENVMERKKLTS